MKRIAMIVIAGMALGSFGLASEAALAAKKDAYAQRKAECKQEAKGKHFGIHFVKRDRWIKNCIAGRHT
jgi:hypothetical protein